MGAGKLRILLACAGRAYTRLFAILSGHDLTFVSTLTEARTALKAGDFDLIMIGLYFDESRMFELLHHIRLDAKYNRVPVVCFRGMIASDSQEKLALEGIEAACVAMGANVFFDLPAFADDATGNARVRKLIDELLDSEKAAI